MSESQVFTHVLKLPAPAKLSAPPTLPRMRPAKALPAPSMTVPALPAESRVLLYAFASRSSPSTRNFRIVAASHTPKSCPRACSRRS